GQDPFWHLATAQLDFVSLGFDRRELFRRAAAAGIAPMVHYIPLHHQPVLAAARRAGDLAGADRAYAGLVSLPCWPDLTADEQERVCVWLHGLGGTVGGGGGNGTRGALSPATAKGNP
nr:DegT/DnrJ/EryC1/StrS family aminotransferase [Planctomycetota bacterium]